MKKRILYNILNEWRDEDMDDTPIDLDDMEFEPSSSDMSNEPDLNDDEFVLSRNTKNDNILRGKYGVFDVDRMTIYKDGKPFAIMSFAISRKKYYMIFPNDFKESVNFESAKSNEASEHNILFNRISDETEYDTTDRCMKITKKGWFREHVEEFNKSGLKTRNQQFVDFMTRSYEDLFPGFTDFYEYVNIPLHLNSDNNDSDKLYKQNHAWCLSYTLKDSKIKEITNDDGWMTLFKFVRNVYMKKFMPMDIKLSYDVNSKKSIFVCDNSETNITFDNPEIMNKRDYYLGSDKYGNGNIFPIIGYSGLMIFQTPLISSEYFPENEKEYVARYIMHKFGVINVNYDEYKSAVDRLDTPDDCLFNGSCCKLSYYCRCSFDEPNFGIGIMHRSDDLKYMVMSYSTDLLKDDESRNFVNNYLVLFKWEEL